jgi:ABC-type transport system substrate-binding protein
MCHRLVFIGTFLSLASLFADRPILAQSPIGATNNRAEANFPESLTFSVELTGDIDLNQVVLEYGVQKLEWSTFIINAVSMFDVAQPPFDDFKVREAYALAIDRNKHIDFVMSGVGLSAHGLYPPACPGTIPASMDCL